MAKFKEGDRVVIIDKLTSSEAMRTAHDLGWKGDYLAVTHVSEVPGAIPVYYLRFPGAETSILCSEDNLQAYVDIAAVTTAKEYAARMALEAELRQAVPVEDTKPAYYKFPLNGDVIDVFDIARAMGLPNTLFMALKYIARIKGDRNKQINDLEKAKECIDRQIKYLKS